MNHKVIDWMKAYVPWFAVAFLVGVIVYLLFTYISTANQLERERRDHGTYTVALKEKYEREARILEKTADELRVRLEDAPSTVEATIVPVHYYHRITVTESRDGMPNAATVPPELPESCDDCLSKVVIPYKFSNKYFVLTDLLRWQPNTRQLVSDDSVRAVKYTDEFNRDLVAIGLQNTEDVDEALWNPRLQVLIGNGIQTDEDNPIVGTGVGVGAELLNFIGLTNISLGANVAVMVVPEAIGRSHLLAGIEWRFVRNIAIGIAYGRSLIHDQVLLDLAIFPLD